MTVQVERFAGTDAEWDRFAESQAGFTHFHRLRWKTVLAEVFGHNTVYLAARRDGALAGVLPLIWVRSAVFGRFLVSMPFLNYGGPLGDAEAVRALADAAVTEARSGKAKLLELRSRISLPLELSVSHRKITVVLDLPDTHAALMQAFPSKLRSQVRRPEKEGVTVRFGPDQVDPFFRVFSRHMRDLGTPTLPLRFFRALADAFGEDVWFGCAWLGQEPIACGAGFRWGREFEMTWASSLSSHNRISPNMGLYWAFMQRAIDARLALFNFGRCTPDGGTHRFKRQWGSRDEILWWYQDSSSGAAVDATPSPDHGAFAWGPRIWKHLPLPIANILGPRVVRFIP